MFNWDPQVEIGLKFTGAYSFMKELKLQRYSQNGPKINPLKTNLV
jgi:hypothetical protein